jgi:hypothetical protein
MARLEEITAGISGVINQEPAASVTYNMAELTSRSEIILERGKIK